MPKIDPQSTAYQRFLGALEKVRQSETAPWTSGAKGRWRKKVFRRLTTGR
jgi:hypothetical protein